MCTVVILRRPGHSWPLILAANRDEMTTRPSAPPAAHWPDRPGVIAGLDRQAGGTWLGVNGRVVAAVMNRVGSLGPAPGMLSRGELPLIALAETDAEAAAKAVARRNGASYRPFNMIVADRHAGFWLRRTEGSERIERAALPDGLAMLTAHDLDDPASRRIRRFLPRFRAAPAPDPGRGDWVAWQALLASRDHDPEGGPLDAMAIAATGAFGTVSASLVALAADGRVLWRYAAGPPDRVPFADVDLGGRA